MIGAFARKFPSSGSATEVEFEVEGGARRYRAASGEVREDKETDPLPGAFTERLEYDGGDVVVSPILEAIRNAFRKRP